MNVWAPRSEQIYIIFAQVDDSKGREEEAFQKVIRAQRD